MTNTARLHLTAPLPTRSLTLPPHPTASPPAGMCRWISFSESGQASSCAAWLPRDAGSIPQTSAPMHTKSQSFPTLPTPRPAPPTPSLSPSWSPSPSIPYTPVRSRVIPTITVITQPGCRDDPVISKKNISLMENGLAEEDPLRELGE